MEDMSQISERELQRQRMKEFYEMTHILFTKPERLILYKILKDYKRRRDLDRLIVGLSLVLRTYTKLELLKYIRYFLWEGHLPEFDHSTKFHSRFRPRRKDHGGGRLGSNYLQVPDRLSLASGTSRNTRGSGATTSSRHIKDVRVFTLNKSPDSSGLGFSVRGGSEHGLGIYVSEIDVGSTAEKSGLEVGDKILEANNISFKGVASSSAVKVLTGSGRLKLVIQRTRKVPEWRLSREKTSWYDVHDDRLISGEFEECGISHHIRGLDVDVLERRVNLKFHANETTLGFNIRGGREYGLGIYVSKVDKEGQADKNGVRIGDQIIDVNGVPFENITHAHAVEVLKGKQHLILTLRDVGRYPVFKELYAEYTWSDGHLKAASSVTSLRDIQFEKEGLRNKAQSVSDIFSRHRRPNALQNEIFLPRKPPRQKLKQKQLIDEDVLYESDSDSLINIEQWTRHLDDEGTDNNGYVSDNESGNIHVLRADIVDYGNVQDSANESASVQDNNDDTDHDTDGDEETSDIYSKISKTDRNHEVSETVTRLHNENQNNSLPYTFEQADDVIEAQYDTPYNMKVNGTNMNYDSTENRVYNNQGDSYNEQTSTLTPVNIEGALYSQIRRGSYSNTSVHHQQPGTSYSDKTSVKSARLTEYEDQTLHIRKISSSTENSDDSDNENSKTGKRKGISRQYDLQQAEKYKSTNESKGKGISRRYDVQQTEKISVITENKRTPVSRRYDIQQVQKSELNSEKTNPRERGDTDTKVTSVSKNELFSVEDLEGRLKELEKRQTSLGVNELNALSTNHDNSVEGSPTHKKGKWKNFKDKIKGSLRIKTSSSSKSSSVRSRAYFSDHGQNVIDEYNHAALEEAARRMLSHDEFDAVMRRVKNYHETHELERLVEALLAILDKPEKLLLLRDIRGVIYPLDMVKFDNMVNVYEIEAYQKLSMKLHLPLNHKLQRKPRKTLMATEIGNRRKRKSVHFAHPERAEEGTVLPEDGTEAENGHFHLRPLDQYQKEEQVVVMMRENIEESRHGSPSKQPMRQKSLEEASVMGQFDYLDNEQSEDNLSVIISSDPGSYGSSEVDRTPGAVIVHLSKTKPDLGMDIQEVKEHGTRDIQISKIHQTGAANDDSTIEVGMSMLAVDNHRIEGCTAEEARGILQRVYSNKQIVSMKLILHKPQTTHF